MSGIEFGLHGCMGISSLPGGVALECDCLRLVRFQDTLVGNDLEKWPLHLVMGLLRML